MAEIADAKAKFQTDDDGNLELSVEWLQSFKDFIDMATRGYSGRKTLNILVEGTNCELKITMEVSKL